MITFLASAFESHGATLGVYSKTADSLGLSGGKATSARYTDEATIGEIVGTATGAGVTLKSGFIGQLYEAKSLAVSSLPAAVVESGTTQLSAVATMDDDSLVRLGGSDAKWAVQDGPLAGITLSGLATAGRGLHQHSSHSAGTLVWHRWGSDLDGAECERGQAGC
jgi:hypothetical protein